MLTPFSAASFAAHPPTIARRTSADWVIAVASLFLAGGQVLFLLDRSGYPAIVATMALTGLGSGAVFAVNPIQVVEGVPASETGSAISFYQLVRGVGYSVASALSATALVGYIRPGARLPTNAGYGAAALVDLAVLAATLVVSTLLALGRGRSAAW